MTATTTYDYIVVGAGSAGCVVASRLAEDRGVRVLLVETGGRGLPHLVRAPALYPLLYRTERDYAYATEPQAGLLDRRVFVPRGKGLGGSSAINASIWHTGQAADYDAWAALGAIGWDAASMAEGFARVRVPTERAQATTELQRAFVEATRRVCGLDVGVDGDAFAGPLALATRDGARVSAADAYVPSPRADEAMPNLHVRLHATVARVVVSQGRARGVDLVEFGATSRVYADREVVLCAGAYGSPVLLMLSGIGPADALRAHGIDVVHALPGVGESLHDHLYTYVTHRAREGGERMDLRASMAHVPDDLRGSPFAGNHVEVGAFVASDGGTPDVQLYFTTWPAPAPNLDARARYDEGPCFTIMPCPLQPKSRGRVTLASPSPFDAPRIDPAYLSHPDDVATFVRAVQLAREVIADSSFERFRGEALVPRRDLEGDALVQEIRGRAGSVHHPVGTCRMGTDALAVVSPTLEVHGIRGLRIADASVMPRITSGNTNAPTIAIAERAAMLVQSS